MDMNHSSNELYDEPRVNRYGFSPSSSTEYGSTDTNLMPEDLTSGDRCYGVHAICISSSRQTDV